MITIIAVVILSVMNIFWMLAYVRKADELRKTRIDLMLLTTACVIHTSKDGHLEWRLGHE